MRISSGACGAARSSMWTLRALRTAPRISSACSAVRACRRRWRSKNPCWRSLPEPLNTIVWRPAYWTRHRKGEIAFYGTKRLPPGEVARPERGSAGSDQGHRRDVIVDVDWSVDLPAVADVLPPAVLSFSLEPVG